MAGILVAILVGWLLVPDASLLSFAHQDAVEGVPASENIKAPYDLEIVDHDRTQGLREDAVARVPSVWDLQASGPERRAEAISRAFAAARAARGGPTAASEPGRAAFAAGLGVPVSAAEYAPIEASELSRDVEEAFRHLALAVGGGLIVGELSELDADRSAGITLRRSHGNEELRRDGELDSIIDLAEARRLARRRGPAILAERADSLTHELPHDLATILVQLAARLVEPSLLPDRAETELRRADARLSVKPVTLSIKKGEMVIRDGERVVRRHLLVFEALRQSNRTSSLMTAVAGGALLFGIMVTIGGGIAGRVGSRRVSLQARDMTFLATLFLAGLAVTRLFLAVGRTLHDSHPNLALNTFLFLLPLAAGTMMVRLVQGVKAALLFAAISSLMLGLLADGDRLISLYAMVGSVSAIAAIGHISARSNFIGAGVQVGLVQAGCAVGIALLANHAWPTMLTATLAAFIGGVLAGLTTLAMTPLVEWAFGYTTDLQLLELANLNHPALKELIVQAPGSYHHSIIVGALVEAAAESIGANSLLARVMAYYHDLGKGCNPAYFVENQRSRDNPHDKLKPSMSAMIIRRHVTDGLELARRHKLGEPILAGIAQHHGTTLIHFFFHRAREQAEDADQISEAEYRYPGQKPQTREAALVMLGDSIEAASRSLQETSPARLQGLVNRIISAKFTDGQLEECDLTLRDLHTIAKAFQRVLGSIYHHRPEYPDLHPTPGGRSQGEATSEAPDNFRRLGL